MFGRFNCLTEEKTLKNCGHLNQNAKATSYEDSFHFLELFYANLLLVKPCRVTNDRLKGKGKLKNLITSELFLHL